MEPKFDWIISRPDTRPVGEHLIIELNGVDQNKLDDLNFIEKTLKQAAEDSGAKIIFSKFHHFKPQGVTGVVGVEESHLSVHTWPQEGYAAVDIFLCTSESGKSIDPEKALATILESFQPKNKYVMKLDRGFDNNPQAAT